MRASPSGKASASQADTRGFESRCPLQVSKAPSNGSFSFASTSHGLEPMRLRAVGKRRSDERRFFLTLRAAQMGNLPLNFKGMTIKVYAFSFRGTLPHLDHARCRGIYLGFNFCWHLCRRQRARLILSAYLLEALPGDELFPCLPFGDGPKRKWDLVDSSPSTLQTDRGRFGIYLSEE